MQTNYQTYLEELEKWANRKVLEDTEWDTVALSLIIQGLVVAVNHGGYPSMGAINMHAVTAVTNQMTAQEALEEQEPKILTDDTLKELSDE